MKILLLGLVFLVGEAICICVPVVTSSVFSCAGQNVSGVVSGLPASKNKVDLSNNSITSVESAEFPVGAVIGLLSMQQNKITMIKAASLYGIVVSALDLSFNLITMIQSGAFVYATLLTVLNLAGNGNIATCLPGTNMFVGMPRTTIQTGTRKNCATVSNASSGLIECVSCNTSSGANNCTTSAPDTIVDTQPRDWVVFVAAGCLSLLVLVIFGIRMMIRRSVRPATVDNAALESNNMQLVVAEQYEEPVKGGSYYDVGVVQEGGDLYEETTMEGTYGFMPEVPNTIQDS